MATDRRLTNKNITAGTLLGLTALALAACNPAPAQQAKADRPVLVTEVRYEPLTAERTLVGTVRPRIETELGFRVAGKVARRLVEVGETVKPGQALAVLDETDLKLQTEQAEAEQRAATATLAQAQAAERRAVDLRKQGWSTDAALDQARAVAEEARGRLARAERSVELTNNSLSYATLVADAAGTVTATLIEPGQVVAAGQGAIRVARSGEKEVVVAVPEALLARARNAGASVVLWSSPDRRYAVKLRELAPTADAATRTYLAKFTLEAGCKEAELGMTATITLAETTGERVARVPLSALFNQGTGPAVYVVDDKTGAVRLQSVAVKAYEARDVLLTGGVAEGDKVVALGTQKLDPAQRVRIVDALAF